MSQFNSINSASTHGIVPLVLNKEKIKLDFDGYFFIIMFVLESVSNRLLRYELV